MVVVAQREVGALLGGNDLTHQLDGWIVLTAVAVALGLDGDLLEALRVVLELDVESARGVGGNGDSASLIADSTEGERPARVACNGVMAINVGRHGDLMAFVDDAGVGHGLAGFSVGNSTTKLLCPGMEHSNCE